MRYPTWQNFEAKYSENPQGAFESLCRMLFRKRYGIGETLPYYYNNAGNETVPIESNGDVVGFQADIVLLQCGVVLLVLVRALGHVQRPAVLLVIDQGDVALGFAARERGQLFQCLAHLRHVPEDAGFPGGIVPSIFGICFVPLMCWYFYVYFKARRHHG